MTINTNPEQTSYKKFLADAMLGRLARWLRILGYDTAFDAQANDWTLIRQARAQERLLLTRDGQLARRRGVSALLIQSQELAEQVRQVVETVGPSPEGAFTRCPLCNERLVSLAREAAQQRVPAHVYRTQQTFRLCPACDRVYWQGSHWLNMKETLDGLEPNPP